MISNKILSGQEPDTCQKPIETILTNHEMTLLSYEVVPDDRQAIANQLNTLCQSASPHLIFTLGGTGVRPTDWAPEATRDVLDKEIPGIGEAMRAESLKKVKTAMLSRGIAGTKGSSLIINLPGSLKGAQENLQVVLPLLEHTVGKIRGTITKT